MPHLSASAMVIHYEEALYQVYAPFTLYLTPTYSYLYLPSCTCIQRLQVWVQDGRMSQWPMHYNQFCHRWIIWKTLSLDWGIACQYANHWESNKFRFQGMLQHIVVDMPVSDCFGEAVRNWHGSSSKETEALSTVLISEFKWQELCQCRWTSISRQTMVTLTAAVICIFDLLLKPVLRVLSVPASSKPVECIFSHCTCYDPSLCQKTDKTLTSLVFLKGNASVQVLCTHWQCAWMHLSSFACTSKIMLVTCW